MLRKYIVLFIIFYTFCLNIKAQVNIKDIYKNKNDTTFVRNQFENSKILMGELEDYLICQCLDFILDSSKFTISNSSSTHLSFNSKFYSTELSYISDSIFFNRITSINLLLTNNLNVANKEKLIYRNIYKTCKLFAKKNYKYQFKLLLQNPISKLVPFVFK